MAVSFIWTCVKNNMKWLHLQYNLISFFMFVAEVIDSIRIPWIQKEWRVQDVNVDWSLGIEAEPYMEVPDVNQEF